MSIYGTILDLEDGEYGPPYVYQGSHILPADDAVHLASAGIWAGACSGAGACAKTVAHMAKTAAAVNVEIVFVILSSS